MNKKEKEELATKLLKKHDYSDEEIKKILLFAFGDKKAAKDKRKK